MQALIEQLKAEARTKRREARQITEAIRALEEDARPQGRPVNPNRDLADAFKRGGLKYADLGKELGVSYRVVSWVIRGMMSRPDVERRLREILAPHLKERSEQPSPS
ncbi:MAG TPA: hypothetical protein VGF98_01080 [Candidatus Tumulicola sp.]|jgi:hypothetical protein